jgi:protein arginine N-methyltransferase 1
VKEIALREPLVDTVEVKAVVTDPCLIKVCFSSVHLPLELLSSYFFARQHINLLTAKKEDLTFTAPFELVANRNDYVHAFLAWFDITFDCTHKKVRFSTGPHAQYTHWKYVCWLVSCCPHSFVRDDRQTVFYTPSTLTVSQKQPITGTLSCAPNARNNRDLDIKISYQVKEDELTEAIFKM